MTVSVTFIGGPECGDVQSVKWGGGHEKQEITFPLNKAMTVNLDDAKNTKQRAFYEHVIAKARNNRFFKVTGEDQKAKEPTDAKSEKPAKQPRRKFKAKTTVVET